MAVKRSIKLKLIIPRQRQMLDAAKSLWATHAIVNEAARYYESKLVEMRGAPYLDENDQPISASEASARQERLIQGARTRANRALLKPNELSEAKQLIRSLFEAIVPQAVQKDGKAKNANAFLSPLTDPASQGVMDIFNKIDHPPAWIQAVRQGAPNAFDAAEAWLMSEEGQLRIKCTGAPPGWLKKQREGERDWPVSFVADFNNKCAEAQGVPTTIRRLKELGVLPLFPPYLTPKIVGARGALSPWDRLAFRLAVGHLMSWESCCIRTAQEHRARQERVSTFRQRQMTGVMVDLEERLRTYEAARHQELSQCALAPKRPFRITPRMVRSWDHLRALWRRSQDRSIEHLTTILKAQQTKLRGRFGDPHLFRWLADPINNDIWDREEDAVGLVATLNAMNALVDRSRETARMTLPEPRYHPRAAQWEAEGGTNFRHYSLNLLENGDLEVSLPTLRAVGDNQYEERQNRFKVAKSKQFNPIEFTQQKNTRYVTFNASSWETAVAKLGAASLLLDWDFLRNRHQERVVEGDIGPVYLTIALDLQEQYPEGWDGKRPKAVNHFLSALGSTKHINSVKPGLRLLSVDLGVRSFACCSVFELVETKPDNGLYFPVHGCELWAKHERSFRLTLPGEEISAKGKQWRRHAVSELRALRQGLNVNRRLYRLAGLDKKERTEELDLITEDIGDGWLSTCTLPVVEALRKYVDYPPPAWDHQVRQEAAMFRRSMGSVVSEWRKHTRSRGVDKWMGNSMWAIEYLTDVRRFLMSWTLAGANTGDINRLDRERRGIFASGLLSHLEQIKENRLKTGSDLIVQAARGYLRDDQGRWEQRYAPCEVVAFEDLSRYRMKTDRPKKENTLLMKWAHRAVPNEVEMQGALYGLTIIDIAAAFSSQYHAGTNTPGIRCHPIKAEEIADEYFLERVARENPGTDAAALQPGDLVPYRGGELFVCLNGEGLRRTHADINATQHLQRRFWTQHGDAFRLSCVLIRIDGNEAWVPRTMGKRALGALGGYGYLSPTGHNSGSTRWIEISKRRWSALVDGASDEESELPDDLAEIDGIEEEHLERTGQFTTFFRDPSGETLPPELWYPARTFWGIVKSRTSARLCLPRQNGKPQPNQLR